MSGGMQQQEQQYQELIVGLLEGTNPEERARRDWAGVSGVLALYQGTSGQGRDAIIRAMGQIIAEERGSPATIAQIIDLAAGLDVSQVEPSVRQLQGHPVASEEPVRHAIGNYLAYREVQAQLSRQMTGQWFPAGAAKAVSGN